MKKFLAIIIGALFVLSFAASAFAIHAEIPEGTQAAFGVAQVKLSGQLKIWQWWKDNVGTVAGVTNVPSDEGSQAFYKQRMRLRADIKLSDNVMGQVELESGPAQGGSEFWDWGNFNAKTDQVAIRNAWILYKGSGLLGFPAGLKMGHMPLILGHGKFFKQTRYGDDAIVLFGDPNKQLHVGVLTIKVSEGAAGATTATCYSPGPDLAIGTADDITTTTPGTDCSVLGPLFVLVGTSTTTTTGTADNTDDIDVYTALFVYKIDDNNSIGANYSYVNHSDSETQFQNFMVHAAGNVAGLGYKAEVDLQFGDEGGLTPGGMATFAATGDPNDVSAHAIWLALNYKLDPVNLRGSFALGSGDDNAADDDTEQFINFLGPDKNVAWIYEYQVRTASGGGNTAGIANTTYYNVGVDFSLAKDLKASVDGWLLQATETMTGVDDDLGWELDAKFVYKIAKNLSYTIMAGYFDPGDFYDDTYTALNPLYDEESVKSVRGDLTLNF